MKLISKRLLFIGAGIILLVTIGYFVWQKYKYKIVENVVSAKVRAETNGLYTISYDSLSFDEVTGYASLKNIRVIPDTNMAKSLTGENMPDILLDISIRSLKVTGVKTAKALNGKKIEGDSVIIDNPEITLYSLKPLQKGTQIDMEANSVYKNILGKLDMLKVGFVYVNNANVKGINFFTKEKNFDFINGKILLEDVLIDSAHHFDSTRILFCKQAAFSVDSFFSYNHSRRELSIKDVNFLGKQKQLLFDEIAIDRFPNDSADGIRLLDAHSLKLSGVNSDEIVKNKNLSVDSIECKEINLYEFPFESLKTTKSSKPERTDSTGFKNVYGVRMNYLNFPKVTFIPFAKSKYSLGNIAIKLKDVRAGQVVSLQTHPMDFVREAEVGVDRFTLQSKDGSYNFDFKNILINSLQQQLQISSFSIIPKLGERQFAAGFHFQKDRYDLRLSGISLSNIDMNSLIDSRLVASQLLIQSTNAVIYRDLHKPLEKKSKVGNYPSQLLTSLSTPVLISKAVLNNANIVYRENEKVSDSIGVINFANSTLTISNITNMPEEISKNNRMSISFDTKILGSIPLKGNFTFILNSNNGDFLASGQAPAFDAAILNKVSIPMGLIKVNKGNINSLDFHIKGNDSSAKGDFVMKYDDLKVDVLKRDKKTGEIKKRGLVSLAANAIVKNSNPDNGNLRKVNPEFERDIYKSFFNLVWKTVFTGMKETVGIE